MPEMTFRQLQDEQRPWVQHNFPGREAYYPLLGAVEELGELAHAHLKGIQGIRGTKEEHDAKAKDAVGDTIIFLADYCSAKGFDLQEIMEETWGRVKKRDWQKDKQHGGEVQVSENVTVTKPNRVESRDDACWACGTHHFTLVPAGWRCDTCGVVFEDAKNG